MFPDAQKTPAPNLRTAHDVRHLTRCCHCGAIGDGRTMVTAGPADGPWHGRCLQAARGLAALAALPASEQARLTLVDIGVEAMRHLLAPA